MFSGIIVCMWYNVYGRNLFSEYHGVLSSVAQLAVIMVDPFPGLPDVQQLPRLCKNGVPHCRGRCAGMFIVCAVQVTIICSHDWEVFESAALKRARAAIDKTSAFVRREPLWIQR